MEDGANPRLVLNPDLQGQHRHILDFATNLPTKRPWARTVEKESGRVRNAFLRLMGRASDKKEPRKDLTAVVGIQKAKPNLTEKYGQRWKVVGKGAYGTVRTYYKRAADGQADAFFAVKEFHRKSDQSHAGYSRRILAEFALAQNLRHANIVRTLDLLQDEETFFAVMEYCEFGTLSSLLEASGPLDSTEADCFFKQLARGVEYLHGVGIAHCDLKPDNLLLTAGGGLKISDFGCSRAVRSPEDDKPRMLAGVRGSRPYIAPEEYTASEFDGRPVDVWACGVIYMFMKIYRHLWYVAREDDELYLQYVEDRRVEAGYAPIEALEPVGLCLPSPHRHCADSYPGGMSSHDLLHVGSDSGEKAHSNTVSKIRLGSQNWRVRGRREVIAVAVRRPLFRQSQTAISERFPVWSVSYRDEVGNRRTSGNSDQSVLLQ